MKTVPVSTTTSLCFGGKVSKASLRMDVLGDLDELIAVVGIVRASSKNKDLKERLLFIQKEIMVVASEIATLDKNVQKLKKRINEEDVCLLEEKIKCLKLKVKPSPCFICPGDDLPCAYLHWARVLARKCERKTIKLFNRRQIKNKNLLMWLNKLSQYLFLIAQKKNK